MQCGKIRIEINVDGVKQNHTQTDIHSSDKLVAGPS